MPSELLGNSEQLPADAESVAKACAEELVREYMPILSDFHANDIWPCIEKHIRPLITERDALKAELAAAISRVYKLSNDCVSLESEIERLRNVRTEQARCIAGLEEANAALRESHARLADPVVDERNSMEPGD